MIETNQYAPPPSNTQTPRRLFQFNMALLASDIQQGSQIGISPLPKLTSIWSYKFKALKMGKTMFFLLEPRFLYIWHILSGLG